MTDTRKTGTKQTDAEKNADEIKDTDATESGARGNVHSEEDEVVRGHTPPPPLPN